MLGQPNYLIGLPIAPKKMPRMWFFFFFMTLQHTNRYPLSAMHWKVTPHICLHFMGLFMCDVKPSVSVNVAGRTLIGRQAGHMPLMGHVTWSPGFFLTPPPAPPTVYVWRDMCSRAFVRFKRVLHSHSCLWECKMQFRRRSDAPDNEFWMISEAPQTDVTSSKSVNKGQYKSILLCIF